MKKMEKAKKWAKENKEIIFWSGVTIVNVALYIASEKLSNKICTDEITEEVISQPIIFDPVRTDVDIKDVFATVEYADGEVGIVDDIIGVVEQLIKRDNIPKEELLKML